MHIDFEAHGAASYTLGLDKAGREHVVLVVKGSYGFPQRNGDPLVPLAETEPFVFSDTFTGEPGVSAPIDETDFSTFKPRCDVLVKGVAHAPEGRPAERVQTGIRIGQWQKLIDVVGNRRWLDRVAAIIPSDPEPFTMMPITYDLAFGGVDALDPDDDAPDAYMSNPVGRGWYREKNTHLVAGRPLPNTERPGEPVSVPWGRYRPQSLGPIGRGWAERIQYAGTYDDDWTENVFPFLPEDFDSRYFQAAPSDQQIDYPRGGEPVTLLNLTPNGREQFSLPKMDLPVVFQRRRMDDAKRDAVADTIIVEPDRRMVHILWRTLLPLKRDIFEVEMAIVGPRTRAFWRARELGKTYHPGIGSIPKGPAVEEDDVA